MGDYIDQAVATAQGSTKVKSLGFNNMNDLGMDFIISPEFSDTSAFTVDQALALLDTTFTSGCSMVNPTQLHTEYLNYITGKTVCTGNVGLNKDEVFPSGMTKT